MDLFNLNWQCMMEKIITIKNRFLASIAAFAVVIWPMTALAAEEASEEGNNKSEEGSAAGENAVRTAVGGINAGTVAAIVAIAAAAAALSDSGSGGGMVTPVSYTHLTLPTKRIV